MNTKTADGFSLDLIAHAGAFGDGTHPTTQAAFQAMQCLAEVARFEDVLDMGCGSGVLALAAKTLWPDARVLGVDIKAEAVEVARENAQANHLQAEWLQAGDYKHPRIVAAAPYDLVICNMTADLLLSLAAGVSPVVAEGGAVVLSGILQWRENEVLQAHAAYGLHPCLPPIRAGEWSALVLRKG